MHNFVKAIKNDPSADLIDVYEALDMYLPGHFAHLSSLAGGMPMDIPDFRDKAVREKYRNDNRCCDPTVAGKDLLSSNPLGNFDYPDEVYDKVRAEFLARKNNK